MPDMAALIGGPMAGALVGALSAWLTGRRARQRDAGELALKIATDAHARLNSLDRWRGSVMRWWPAHQSWDQDVLAELSRLDPAAARRVGEPPHAPIWGTDTEGS